MALRHSHWQGHASYQDFSKPSRTARRHLIASNGYSYKKRSYPWAIMWIRLFLAFVVCIQLLSLYLSTEWRVTLSLKTDRARSQLSHCNVHFPSSGARSFKRLMISLDIVLGTSLSFTKAYPYVVLLPTLATMRKVLKEVVMPFADRPVIGVTPLLASLCLG